MANGSGFTLLSSEERGDVYNFWLTEREREGMRIADRLELEVGRGGRGRSVGRGRASYKKQTKPSSAGEEINADADLKPALNLAAHLRSLASQPHVIQSGLRLRLRAGLPR